MKRVWVLSLLIVELVRASVNEPIYISGAVNSTILLDPCDPPQSSSPVETTTFNWHKEIFGSGQKENIWPGSSDRLILYENGTLIVLVSMDDTNVDYVCQATSHLEKGTSVVGESRHYAINPIVPAFIDEGLQNETVDWNSTYLIPCSGGGTNFKLEYKVNNQVQSNRYLRIVKSSTIECRSSNFAGSEAVSGYINVTPGSKELAMANPWTRADLCKPHTEVLYVSSPCYEILRTEANSSHGFTDGHYLLRTIYFASSRWTTDSQLKAVFSAWDTSSLNSSGRCLPQAKRLLCLLAYPTCLQNSIKISEDFDEEESDDDKETVTESHLISLVSDIPICKQHCQVISSLFCAATPGHPSENDHSLQSSFLSSVPNLTVWLELMRLMANVSSQLLPSYVRGQDFCEPLLSASLLNTDQEKDVCFHIAFEQPSAPTILTTANTTSDCFEGTGEGFRGTFGTPSNCIPWNLMPLSHPLTPLVFPNSLGREIGGSPVCRNPLSLARRPFCLAPKTTELNSSLQYVECLDLPQCGSKESGHNTMGPSIKQAQGTMNLASISTLVAALFLLVILILLVCICRVRLWNRGKEVSKLQRRLSSDSGLGNDTLKGCCQEDADEIQVDYFGRRQHNLIERRLRLRGTRGGIFAQLALRCFFFFRDGFHFRWFHRTVTQKDGQKAQPDSTSVDDEDEEVEILRNSLNLGEAVDGRYLPLASKIAMETKQLHLETGFQEPKSAKASILSGPVTEDNESTDVAANHPEPELHIDGMLFMASIVQVLRPKLKKLAYPRKLLVQERVIAKRAFGLVILSRAPKFAFAHHFKQSVPNDYVVVKTLEDGATPAAETAFFRETELLVDLKHPNILTILGICVPLLPFSIICEYMSCGDLTSFLQWANPKPFTAQLFTMALDVCEACIFLASKGYVHRDLATRNCLIQPTTGDPGYHVKLADFSMCRQLPESGVDLIDIGSLTSPLAFRCLPLESLLEGRFQVDTDVWSFGVLLWEIFSFARQLPYGDCDISQVLELLQEGQRLPQPDVCSDEVYQISLLCWAALRANRPSFSRLKSLLLETLQSVV